MQEQLPGGAMKYHSTQRQHSTCPPGETRRLPGISNVFLKLAALANYSLRTLAGVLALFVVLAGSVHAGRYELEKGKGVEVCEAYEKSLNSFQPKLPMVCGRPVSSALGFGKPNWEQPKDNILAEPFGDFGEFLWERDANPVKYFRGDRWPQWKGTRAQYKVAHVQYLVNRERVWIDKPPLIADFDIDNDGKPEHVYFEHPCGSVYGDLFAVLTPDYKAVDRKKTELVTPHPPFKQLGLGVFRPVKKGDVDASPFFLERGYKPVEDSMGYAHYDFFFFKGKTYFDQWWKNHPDFKGKSDMDVGHLRVFEASPSSTQEICTYRFKYEG
jgi:hypothetical protein